MSTGDSRTIKINDRRLSVRVVKNCALDDRIIFWLVFMAIICFVVLSTLIMPKEISELFFFSPHAFGHHKCFCIIFHSRRSEPTTPSFAIRLGTAFVWSLASLIAYKLGLQFQQKMFCDKNVIAWLSQVTSTSFLWKFNDLSGRVNWKGNLIKPNWKPIEKCLMNFIITSTSDEFSKPFLCRLQAFFIAI